MIEFQKKCGWEFIFQGANIDVEKEADSLGISRDKAVKFKATKKGVRDQMNLCCYMISDAKVSKKHK